MLSKIHAVSGANMNTKFAHAIADRRHITKIVRFDLAQTRPNSRLSDFVANGGQPLRERLTTISPLVAEKFGHIGYSSLIVTARAAIFRQANRTSMTSLMFSPM
jgi:hypothetical protein